MKNLSYVDFEVAYEKCLELVVPTQKTEIIYILDSIGRVCSKDIICTKNLPSFNSSAMDGFACKISDAGKSLKIVDTIFAGDKKAFEELKDNECYKIMTGAKVPQCVETIVQIERCKDITKNSVQVPSNLVQNSNIKFKAEEYKTGDILIKIGEKISSSHIALLASQGITNIEVFCKLQIAVISTGNELVEPWQKAKKDEIYNSNAFALIALLKENSFEASYCGVISDNFEKSVEFLKELQKFDLILTSGGVSMGDADFIASAFLKCGLKVAYHGVNLKPGKAMMIGTLNQSLVVSLPGNPLAALINAYIFLLPMLKKCQGELKYFHDFIVCINQKSFNVKEKRVEAVLGKVENGKFLVTMNNKYGSGMISAIYKSNALMLSNGNNSDIKEDNDIKVLEFNGNFVEKNINFLN